MPSFDRETYIQISQNLGIPESTADKQIARYTTKGLLNHPNHGEYIKSTSTAKPLNRGFSFPISLVDNFLPKTSRYLREK